MIFTSLEFILLFLPIVIFVNAILPKKCRNLWLMAVSLFFYAWGEPFFVLIMLMQVMLSYLCALGLDRTSPSTGRKVFLASGIISNLSVLFIYKYLNFFVSVMHQLIPVSQTWIPQTHLLLPIGISFFSFQALSYVIDVYRGTPAQRNPLNLCLYISFFPQLIAGPIVRYAKIESQLNYRTVTLEKFSRGIIRFLIGFNKKVLLANQFAIVADAAFGSSSLSVLFAWLGALCYSLQIYFDFGGYSEMAIGLGLMFGFEFEENFNDPYISKTMTEFWRRWHISLGSWFKDYVYFPLGGSHVSSKIRLVFNLMTVWLLTGLWHGASWNFIVWGLFHGLIVVMEKVLLLPKRLEQHSVLSLFYRFFTLLMVMLGWVVFRAETGSAAVTFIKTMFMMHSSRLLDAQFVLYFREFFVLVAAGIVLCTPVISHGMKTISLKAPKMGEAVQFLFVLVQFALFVFSISYLVMNAHNPFIYFNF